MSRRVPRFRSPRLARVLLGWLAPREERSFILGDLEEEFCELARARGFPWACRWYWSQTLRSVSFFFAAGSSVPFRSISAVAAGSGAAIVAAFVFGGALCHLLEWSLERTGLEIVALVSGCALVSAVAGGWAWAGVAGRVDRWSWVFVAGIVLFPEIQFSARGFLREPDVSILLPLVGAIGATAAGLVLGHRWGRRTRPCSH